MLPVVLIDATTLRTASGHSGIGRYTFDLMCGLESIRNEWRDRLDLVALCELGWRGGPVTTRNLSAAAEEAIAARGTEAAGLRRRRRLRLGSACRQSGTALLHQTEAYGTPVLSPTPRLVTCYDLIPLVMHEEYLGRGPHGALRYASRFVRDAVRYRTARRLVAISERSKADVVRVLGVDPNRVDAVTTGIDLTRFHAPRDPGRDETIVRGLGLGSRPFALYVGSGDPRKNAEGMCAAVALAGRSVDIELCWAGKVSASEKRRAVEAARRHGVEARVRFIGFVADDALPALYRAAMCHLFISRLEGFGITVVEAMASGCPVIVGHASGADELSADAGMTVDPDDAPAAAAHLVELVRNPALRQRWAEKGLRRAPVFDRIGMARGYVEAYLKTLATGEAPWGRQARSSAG
jgi:glycosyltransferase involved in cell wall biosynthesis